MSGTDGEQDPAASDGDQDPGERAAAGGRRPGLVARIAADARIAWATALVLAAALGVASVVYAPLAVTEGQREEALAAATAMAARLVTFDGDRLDAWTEEVRALATPEYADEVTSLLDEELRGAAADAQLRSTGSVVAAYVQSLEGGEAEVFSIVRQRVESAGGEAPREQDVRMTLRLQRTSGGWRVADVAVLGA